jgi:hypothetical protein
VVSTIEEYIESRSSRALIEPILFFGRSVAEPERRSRRGYSHQSALTLHELPDLNPAKLGTTFSYGFRVTVQPLKSRVTFLKDRRTGELVEAALITATGIGEGNMRRRGSLIAYRVFGVQCALQLLNAGRAGEYCKKGGQSTVNQES